MRNITPHFPRDHHVVVLAAVVIWPQVDLDRLGLVLPAGGEDFFLSDLPPVRCGACSRACRRAHSRAGFLLLAIVAASQRRPVAGLDAKAWLFLFLGLLVGPGLVVNGILKDHWGRARPAEIIEFGGTAHFSPAF